MGLLKIFVLFITSFYFVQAGFFFPVTTFFPQLTITGDGSYATKS